MKTYLIFGTTLLNTPVRVVTQSNNFYLVSKPDKQQVSLSFNLWNSYKSLVGLVTSKDL